MITLFESLIMTLEDILKKNITISVNKCTDLEQICEDILDITKDDIKEYHFILHSNNELIANFKLIGFPGCCAFLISYNAFIATNYRNRGLGALLNVFRQDLGRELGYTAIICTDITNNDFQRKILKKNGWEDIFKIVNKRTKNEVNISVLKL